MKFIIDVDGFWIEDDDLEPALKRHIIYECVKKINETIKEKVDSEVTKRVSEVVDSRLSHVINQEIERLVEGGLLMKNGKEGKISEYIQDQFHRNHGWNKPHDIIEKIAKRFGEELKAQYNTIFASKIVQNMREQGMLKDDVAQLLLEDH